MTHIRESGATVSDTDSLEAGSVENLNTTCLARNRRRQLVR